MDNVRTTADNHAASQPPRNFSRDATFFVACTFTYDCGCTESMTDNGDTIEASFCKAHWGLFLDQHGRNPDLSEMAAWFRQYGKKLISQADVRYYRAEAIGWVDGDGGYHKKQIGLFRG